jgi:hypothetical protein
MLGLPYIRLVNLSRTRPKGFTCLDSCGKNGDVTGARILLSLSPLPDTGTVSYYPDRTLVGPFTQPLFKQASQRLTLLHAWCLALL